ncbi:MAG: translation initiation factor IF-1 [Verrucomicrobia bacterium]|nr:translation initiation factor IF-1 [Verrucomicrobiota bacterium]
MTETENIQLDATLQDVIGTSAFRAKLANGHEITAYVARSDRERVEVSLHNGAAVVVEMSPYDMSKGRITLDK